MRYSSKTEITEIKSACKLNNRHNIPKVTISIQSRLFNMIIEVGFLWKNIRADELIIIRFTVVLETFTCIKGPITYSPIVQTQRVTQLGGPIPRLKHDDRPTYMYTQVKSVKVPHGNNVAFPYQAKLSFSQI